MMICMCCICGCGLSFRGPVGLAGVARRHCTKTHPPTHPSNQPTKHASILSPFFTLLSRTGTLHGERVESQQVTSARPPKLRMNTGTRLVATETTLEMAKRAFIRSYKWRSSTFFTIQEYME